MTEAVVFLKELFGGPLGTVVSAFFPSVRWPYVSQLTASKRNWKTRNSKKMRTAAAVLF